ncbi:MAG TPA: PAS domain S-box protein [Elusimicrobiales bacterium]|nr:PAS domain S-box protein [Elusimicrobiales bacterium]
MKKHNGRSAGLGCPALSVASRFRRMVEGLRREYFFYCHGADGVFQYVSPSVRNILGYAPREFLVNFNKYLAPGRAAAEVRRRTALSIKGVRQPPYEVDVLHKDGSVRTLEVLELPVKERGRVIAVEGIARDITREKRMREALAEHDREMTAQAALILRSSGDGIIGVDRKGRITFMNDSAEKMLGWKHGELKGEELHSAVHCRRADGSRYPVEECPMSAALLKGRTSRVDDEVLWRRDGTPFPVSYSARPIIREGARVGAVITFRDIAGQRRLEEMREFLTHAMVHDLNNPLTSIMAGVELAAECPAGRPGCANREHLTVVLEAAAEMKKMVSDILDISRMERGEMRLARKRIRPSAPAGEAVRAMERAAGLEDRSLGLAVPAGLPAVNADPGVIRRVLENLIANALRYAPSGSAVSISAARAAPGMLRFSVSDEGPGIPPEHLDKVFDKYFQSKPAPGGGRQGKGLGLAFCRLAVEAHGGSIKAENLRPSGCRFSFTLPAVR